MNAEEKFSQTKEQEIVLIPLYAQAQTQIVEAVWGFAPDRESEKAIKDHIRHFREKNRNRSQPPGITPHCSGNRLAIDRRGYETITIPQPTRNRCEVH